MQREISDNFLGGNTVFPYDNAGRSCAINRTASNYNDAKEKVQQIRELIKTGRYDKNIARYIPGLLELKISRDACSKTSTRGKNQTILPIVICNNWTFRSY